MGMSEHSEFDSAFQALCEGHSSFRWQQRLYDKMVRGCVPHSCLLPTGLGKTSIIPIWLIALADSARTSTGRPQLPRRLVYIVNRRTVVDQATDGAKRLLGRIYRSGQRDGLSWATEEAITTRGLKDEPPLLDERAPPVAALRDALATLSGDDTAAPLAVSTLRGELADNGEWKVNPARPAIIIGTVDMIGSKLLFSGYGDGRYWRAHHAGLIGHDALIVHDEAHLTPAFTRLLRAVEEEQRCEFARAGDRADITRPIRVLELSATTRRNGANDERVQSAEVDPCGIEDEDAEDTVLQQRLNAVKRLSFVAIDATKKDTLAGAVAQQAMRHNDKRCRVLVYVRSPETAADVRDRLVRIVEEAKQDGDRISADDARQRVGLLTGTIRGHERDKLAGGGLFSAFKSNHSRPLQLEDTPTLYLVSTSAGEVGVDLDADHLVCDLTTLESMAQRFGRVNRLGVDKNRNQREASITLVEGPIGDKDPLKDRLQKTAECLRKLPEKNGEVDASPAALSKLLESADAQTAFSPPPTILPATDILFDAWSLTAVRGELPGRPEVAPYLHGVAEWEPPETFVAWRFDVRLLAEAFANDGASAKDIETVFRRFPIHAQERLRDSTRRVHDHLKSLAKQDRHAPGDDNKGSSEQVEHSTPSKEKQKISVGSMWAVVLNSRGELRTLEDGKGKLRLPTIADCADEKSVSLRHCTLVLPVEAGGLKDGCLDGKEPPPADPKSLDVADRAADGKSDRQRLFVGGPRDGDNGAPIIGGALRTGLIRRHVVQLHADAEADDEAAGRAIEYRVAKGEAAEPAEEVTLRRHACDVEAAAERIGQALGLEDPIRQALTLAAHWHDAGKARAVWQRYARNDDPSAEALAKAPRYLHPKALAGYRHEFGSLLDATRGQDAGALSAEDARGPAELAKHSERDLILHLIAAHHGWARPHFEPDAYPKRPPPQSSESWPSLADCEDTTVEVMQRFGRLQQRFGRWGLAWLESLLRCADALASRPADEARTREIEP